MSVTVLRLKFVFWKFGDIIQNVQKISKYRWYVAASLQHAEIRNMVIFV
jgi:hypothetical protein